MALKFVNSTSFENGGDGFAVNGAADIEFENCKAFGNDGHGFSVTIPNTPISLTPADLEQIEEILKTSPESTWLERIQMAKGIVDLGSVVAPYLPTVINFARAHAGL
jgi:hypothetical protein